MIPPLLIFFLLGFPALLAESNTLSSVSKPRIKLNQQKTFYPFFEQHKDPFSKGWCLFNYSGWFEKKQFCLLKAGDHYHIFYTDPKQKKITQYKNEIKQSSRKSFFSAAKELEDLPHLEQPILDGSQYEYTHFILKNKKIKMLHRKFINNPFGHPKFHVYRKILETFYATIGEKL